MLLPDPSFRRIAVLRANGLGDLIFALPAFEALRAAYPNSEIVLLGTGWQRELLEDRPSPIDRVIQVPASRGVREEPGEEEDVEELDGFFVAMQWEGFDLALQLHGGGCWSNPFIHRLGARVTAGSRDLDAPPLDLWIRYVYYQPEVVRYLEVVRLVGATPVTLEPQLYVTDRDRKALLKLCETSWDSLAVLHPGARDPRRRWPAKKFAAVGDVLAREGMKVVVTGVPAEREVVTAVVEGMEEEAVSLCGRLTLGTLAALLERAGVVVANDTGPLHLAAAVGSPTVGIFWCGNLVNGAPLMRARHRPVASFRTGCPVCGIDCTTASCSHRPSFVAEIEVEEVISAARDLMFCRPVVQPGYRKASCRSALTN